MKDIFDHKKAEDILTDDLLVEKLIKEEHKKDYPNDDIALSSKIYQTVSENRSSLESSQKVILGQRISQTIRAYKQRKLYIQLSAAAAVLLLLLGITILFPINQKPGIREFAEINQVVPVSGNTRLILSGKEEIEIGSNQSKIEYTGTGKEIRIDASRQVSQNTEGTEPVMNTLVVPNGKRAKITLSDNSSIWLNSGTKLIYPARFASDKREVYLEGEAIFEVSHDTEHPFHVITPNVEIKVLGTIFNISAYKDDQTTSAVLESGSVELSYTGGSIFGKSKSLMVPGMLAVYDPQKRSLEQTRVNTKNFISWRDGYLTFEQQPLSGILKKIARYYNVTILLKDQELANETFSGSLAFRDSSAQMLEVIAEIIHANVDMINNQIIITRIKSGGMPM